MAGYFDDYLSTAYGTPGSFDLSAQLLYGDEIQSNMPYANAQNGLANFGITAGEQDSWWGDTFSSFDNLLPTLGGLASLYMQWDKLEAEKAKARDAHNATATQYNNEMKRAANLGKSIYGDDYQHTQSNIAKSTV